MTLVELPSNDGKIIAVNPHHVTAVQPYQGFVLGREGQQDMSVVWTKGTEQGTNLYVCAWSVSATLDHLNAAKRDDALAFAAGYRAARERAGLSLGPDPEEMLRALLEWQGVIHPEPAERAS